MPLASERRTDTMPKTTKTAISAALLCLTAAGAHAQTTTDAVKYTSYVQNKTNSAGSGNVATTAGTGTAAGTYFTNDGNVDTEGPTTLGPSASTFAAYSLLDFATPFTFSAPVASVSGLTLTMTEFPAGFGTANPTDIYLVTDSATSDYYSANAAQNSPLIYDTSPAGQSNPLGLGSQLGATYFLGQAAYSKVKNQIDQITLTLSTPAQALFLAQLNSGGDIRFAVSQDSSALSGAAEYDGSYYAAKSPAASPLNLSFSAFDATGAPLVGTPAAAPEPSGFLAMFVGAGVLGLAPLRRRKANPA